MSAEKNHEDVDSLKQECPFRKDFPPLLGTGRNIEECLMVVREISSKMDEM